MAITTRTQRRYDHRLRVLVQTTGDLDLAIQHGMSPQESSLVLRSDSEKCLPQRRPGIDWFETTNGDGLGSVFIQPSRRAGSAPQARTRSGMSTRQLIRLIDGSRAYLHAVVDNFSRRILAWNVAGIFHPAVTAQLLLDASKSVPSGKPMLLVDGGVENFNSTVDKVVESGLLKRVLAQTEITFSNSLIESWWRVLKHQWLYLNTLDTVTTVRKLVAFYIDQHNKHFPHSAFRGQTPDEMYFGTGSTIPKKLEALRIAARKSRMDANRTQTCQTCEEIVAVSS